MARRYAACRSVLPLKAMKKASQSKAVKEKKISRYFITIEPHEGNTGSADMDIRINLRKCVEAIDNKIFPERVAVGSSGSYFVLDICRNAIAIFKPKDEEPFASLNPRWHTYLQRMLCFCCFGRKCLIPKMGYMSEVGASLVDERLQLNIVPQTRLATLSSPTFAGDKKNEKPKIGSYQIFVHGYQNASKIISKIAVLFMKKGNVKLRDMFLESFQKMCVLDYVIRNTDRHLENWLIRFVPGEVKIAAIDNGLAFPVQHPEATSFIRTYPQPWLQLSWSKIKWMPTFKEKLLSILTPQLVNEMCHDLKTLFKMDSGVNRNLIKAQLDVFKGQIWNLRLSLLSDESPFDLARRPLMLAKFKHREGVILDDWDEDFEVEFFMRLTGLNHDSCDEHSPKCFAAIMREAVEEFPCELFAEEESRKEASMHLVNLQLTSTKKAIINTSRVSSLSKAKGVTVMVLRFIIKRIPSCGSKFSWAKEIELRGTIRTKELNVAQSYKNGAE